MKCKFCEKDIPVTAEYFEFCDDDCYEAASDAAPCDGCGKPSGDGSHARCDWTREDYEAERGDFLYKEAREEGRL